MKEIALAFDVHCATASRAVNNKTGKNVLMEDLTLLIKFGLSLA
jgi:DNA-directed RNA polymerase specialized sigma54-like protein